MRRGALWAAATAVAAVVATASSGASTTFTRGNDISWPQCSGRASGAVPGDGPAFVILGLTDGAGHTANPCVSAQLAWARDHGVAVGAYLVASFPSQAQLRRASRGPWGRCGDDRTCRLRTDGVRQAADALRVMRRAGFAAPMVWVDVEFRRTHAWRHRRGDNSNVLRGIFRGLRDAHVPAGVYTTSYMWRHIAGSYRVDLPNWLPAGTGNPGDAKTMGPTTATGGVTWLVQYTRRFDVDLTCPVLDAVPGHPGPLWRWRHTTLRLGDSGAAVSALQHALRVQVTGTYELQTALAVTQFQRAHGLPVDGQVDRDDWRALGAFKRFGGHPFLLTRVAD
jgi:hypothetical protein